MNLTVKQAKGLKGEIHVPGDKSISHRAVMLGSLAEGETKVENFLPSEDCLCTIECFRTMGIDIQREGNRLVIKGRGLNGLQKPKDILYIGNSGTTIRLLSGILAGQNFEAVITGDESIQKRPMGRIVEPLKMMGAEIKGREKDTLVPLTIKGKALKSIGYTLPIASAQVKSAILFAGLYADGITSIIEPVPTRDHSERMLEFLGANIKHEGLTIVMEGDPDLEGREISIPGDISSAAYFMVAGNIIQNAKLKIQRVGVNPTRTGIIEVLHRMGANLAVMNEELLSEEPRADIFVAVSQLKGIEIGGNLIPRLIDELPVIAVAATQAEGKTVIKDAKELRAKESDRIATMTSELKKMGAKVEEKPDGMIIQGPTKLKGATVQSYGDHRVAMSLAIAGLIAEGETVIEDTACIETSFPGFGKVLKDISS